MFVSFLRITFKIGSFTHFKALYFQRRRRILRHLSMSKSEKNPWVYYELKVENGNKSINLQLIVKLRNRELEFRTMSWLVHLKTA